MVPECVKRWLSWLWPITVTRAKGRHGDVTVRYEQGRLVLNSTNANQSFGSLHLVWQQAFEKIGLPHWSPEKVLLLGLGGGSVPHILREEMGIAVPITAVELDPAMIGLARTHFGLGVHDQLTVIEGDATVLVHSIPETFDLIVVDLFDDLDLARGVDTLGFAQALRKLCIGTLCFNTVAYDATSGARCQRVKEHLQKAFGAVDEVRLLDVNRVFIGQHRPLDQAR